MKIYSIHPSINNIDSFFLSLKLDRISGVYWDDEQPDILFASEWIYYHRKSYEKFRSLYNIASVRIFMAGEAITPDWNIFDYAVCFDNHHQNGDRFIRVMSPFDMFNDWIPKRVNGIESVEQARKELSAKSGFCNFVYSNPNAHSMRDRLFYELSKYKRVDSLGCHLNNVQKEGTGYTGHVKDVVPMKRNYKFSIACENAAYPGYTTEKILTSLAAHTIPIYFGNPNICEDINPNTFINVHDFDSLASLVKFVKEVDNNDELWCNYISTPWLTPEQEAYHIQRTANYKSRVAELLVTPEPRLCIGTHSDLYRQRFFSETFPMDKTFFHRVINKCNKLKRRIL